MLSLALVSVSLAVAACGSSSGSGTTSASSGSSTAASSSTRSSSRASFVACLKQHGVTLPSRAAGSGAPGGAPGGGAPGSGGPPAGGGGFFGGGTGSGRGGFFRNNPKFAAAFKACGGNRFGAGRGRVRARITHAAVDKYVACVRQHGYPQMPNPNFSGTGGVFPASIRKNAKFLAASRACESLLVPARPSGTAGSSA